MTTLTPEKRLFPEGLQLRNVDTTQALTRLSGIAVPYGQPTDIGWYLEEFVPGSLAKSIKEAARGLPLLLFHDDQSFPIGVAEEWHEEPAGLRGVWKLDGSDTAQRAAKLAADGMLAYMSIRFVPIRSEWTYVEDYAPDLGASNKDSVKRVEARLLETSLVSTPAYQGASVKWVRTGETPIQREGGKRELNAWKDFLSEARATR